ncbi:MAG TPA: 3'-5' exonuclease, partial [Dongiaceae bacterium]
LLHNLTLFAREPQVLAQYQQQFRYILVDEYQDSNVAQYLWLRLLAQGRRNLCCVGDDDQSIYGWRWAEVGNILRFESDFPGARIIRLERNYRSTGHILGAASGLIAHNRGRLGKTLHTDGEAGDQIRIRGVWDGEEEARQAGEEIEALQRRGTALGKIAILVRAGFQTREFEERFIKLGLPYRVLGGLRFYERQEVRDALAYLRLVHQPADDLAFERIVNKPRRGIGDTTLRQIHATGRAAGLSLVEASRALSVTDELKPASRRALGSLVGDLDRWRAMAVGLPHAELAETVLDESGYTGMLLADKSPDAPGRLENLKELVTAMAEFESLPGFLEHVSLVMENAEGDPRDMVNIMTLHSAKGLEFDAVFLPGWEEGLFPSQRTLDENGTAGLEEERRLAYVGITRARKRVEISYAANRRVHNLWQNSLPSRFIAEIPREHVDEDSAPGLRTMAEPALTRFEGLRDGWGQPRRAAPLIDGQASRVARDAAYPPGARIFHRKFGYGSVVA